MVIDNCPTHPNIQASLQAIKLVFLPPNTTAKLQPCDQGIIQNLKLHYRKYLLIKLISAIEAKKEFSPNLLDALFYVGLSWDNVSLLTIKNCFHHCRFRVPNDISVNDATDENSPDDTKATEASKTADGNSLLE